jgi:Cu+-exporting ATPase
MPAQTDTVQLCVKGMTCANCALSVERYLQRQGLDQIQVSFADDEVRFRLPQGKSLESIIDGLEHIGYPVVSEVQQQHEAYSPVQRKLAVAALLSLPLVLAMVLPVPLLHHPWFQLALSLPVFLLGFEHFGRSGWNSLRSGVPNMDVLIVLGSSAAFLYSLVGLLAGLGPHFLFFETSASIVALVLLGQVIEERAVRKTTSSLRALAALQSGEVLLLRRAADGRDERISVPAAQVRPGDRLAAEQGDKIPLDGKILRGEAELDESMLSGESFPQLRKSGDLVTGGSTVVAGWLEMEVTAVGKDTVLSGIIDLVRKASLDKSPAQRLADRISAWFVPVVVCIALLTFILATFVFGLPARTALLQAIAVLVISCPCAMGLATPTAVAVGLGRASRSGILVKGASTLEALASVKRVILDKTGTLTSGRLRLQQLDNLTPDSTEEELIARIVSLASASNHPVSRSLVAQWSVLQPLPAFRDIRENRGLGLSGTDDDGRMWKLGSARWALAEQTVAEQTAAAEQTVAEQTMAEQTTAAEQTVTGLPAAEQTTFKLKPVASATPSGQPESSAGASQANVPPGDVFLSCNNRPMAALHLRDEIRPGARDLIAFLHRRGIEPILLSGDREQRVKELADALGIQRWYASQLPEDKLRMVQALQAEMPSAMVGDGINDAPALECASVGISLVDSTRAARDAAGVVLLGGRPDQLIEAFALARHTLLTVRQNLFWAFFYNVLAIPVAAIGLLSPMIAAGAMAFSDLMVIGNSLRLKAKKIRELGAHSQTPAQPAFSGEGGPFPGRASGKFKTR